MTLWGNRSLLQSFFNLSATALAIWTASHTFYWLAGVSPGGQSLVLTSLLGPLFVLAAMYFLVNTGWWLSLSDSSVAQIRGRCGANIFHGSA